MCDYVFLVVSAASPCEPNWKYLMPLDLMFKKPCCQHHLAVFIASPKKLLFRFCLPFGICWWSLWANSNDSVSLETLFIHHFTNMIAIPGEALLDCCILLSNRSASPANLAHLGVPISLFVFCFIARLLRTGKACVLFPPSLPNGGVCSATVWNQTVALQRGLHLLDMKSAVIMLILLCAFEIDVTEYYKLQGLVLAGGRQQRGSLMVGFH